MASWRFLAVSYLICICFKIPNICLENLMRQLAMIACYALCSFILRLTYL